MIAVFKHELSSYFHSLTAYIFGAFMLLFVGIGAMLYNIQSSVANFEYVLSFVSIVFVIIVPILTMKVIAEERKQKTDQLLYSLPIKTTGIVIGKFLALLVIFLIPVAITAVYPLIFSQYGEVYLLTSYGSLIAFFIMGAALISVGMFISCLTENLGMAAGIGVVVILFNYYSVTLADYISATAAGSAIALAVIAIIIGVLVRFITKSTAAGFIVGALLLCVIGVTYMVDSTIFEGLLSEVMKALSLFDRFSDFVNGIFSLSGIVFYLTVIALFVFLSVQSLEKRRYN